MSYIHIKDFIYCAKRINSSQQGGLGLIMRGLHFQVSYTTRAPRPTNTGTTLMHSPAPVKSLVFELYGSCGGLLSGYGAGPAAVPGVAGLGE